MHIEHGTITDKETQLTIEVFQFSIFMPIVNKFSRAPALTLFCTNQYLC